MDMVDDRMALPHKLTLSERKKLTMNGVTEVVSFEEDAVILKTALGTLVIQGRDLQLKTLSLDGGQVDVEGTVSALIYEEPKRSGGALRRLFG
jgi:sporulation protein YabP